MGKRRWPRTRGRRREGRAGAGRDHDPGQVDLRPDQDGGGEDPRRYRHEVETKFRTAKAAKQSFSDGHRRWAYKADRYGGWLGGLRWTTDLFSVCPAEANRFHERPRTLRGEDGGRHLRVADLVGNSLSTAKRQMAQGKRISPTTSPRSRTCRGSPARPPRRSAPSSRSWRARSTPSRSPSSILATRYTEARKGLDEQIKALQEENKGLWDKAKDAIGGVIQTIRQLAAMLMDTLARAPSAVGKIIKDPIGFLGNLIAGVKAG